MFDGNAYRKEVLKPLLDSGQGDFDDAFAVFGLDPATDDTALIKERVDAVVAFWRKEQSSPRYKSLVSLLLKERDRLTAEVLDPAARAAARDRVVASRAADASARFGQLDEMLDTLERRMGGIPASRVDRLRATAKRAGVTDEEFDARIATRTILDDASRDVAPPPPAIRQQVRSLLAEANRLDDAAAPVVHRTLFDFLGVSPDAPVEELRAAHEAIGARNRQRRHDRYRTVVGELLVLAEDLVIGGDRASYLAGVAEDVAEHLRPQVETAVLLEDLITPVEFEKLLRAAISEGLDPDAARAVLVRVARELGAPIETGAAVEYLVCAACAAANPEDSTTCSRCGAELHRDCPSCGRRSPRSLPRCPGCGLDLRALAEAEGELVAVRAALEEAHPADARARLDVIEQWAGALPEVADLRRRADAAHAEALEQWERLTDLLAHERFDDAEHAAGQLRARAADVPGPDGQDLDDAEAAIAAGLAGIRERVAKVLAKKDVAAREAAVLALAAELPSSADVLGALRSIPVAPPTDVTTEVGADAVTVHWAPSSSPGELSYRVFRAGHDAEGLPGSGRPIGTTEDASLVDDGAPAGRLVSYWVQAVRHGIASERVAAAPVFGAFDVDALTAVEHDGAIELRWAKVGHEHSVWVDRDDLTDPKALNRRMRGGDAGVMDTNVIADHEYRYTVVVEYQVGGKIQVTPGRDTVVTAVETPPPPRIARITTVGREITVEPQATSKETVVLRAAVPPTARAGTQVERRHLRELGREIDRGRDLADGAPRWYVPAAVFGLNSVIGEAAPHPGMAEVSGLTVAEESGAVVLRWTWPPACTESLVVWRSGSPPASALDPAATTAKVTNTSYELKGGWRLDGPPAGPLHFLVRPVGRIDNKVVPVPGEPDTARASHP